MASDGQTTLKLHKGGFTHRYPELSILSGLVVAVAILAFDSRSAIGPLLLAALWIAGMWLRFGRRRHPLVVLNYEGLWLERRLSADLHGWTEIRHVGIGIDQQGRQEVQLDVAGKIVALPRPLRNGRTELEVGEALQYVADFRRRYSPPGPCP